MMKNVDVFRCSSCHVVKGVASILWRQQGVAAGANVAPAYARERFPLCTTCTEWISQAATLARQNHATLDETTIAGPVKLGIPDADDHCYFCRAQLHETVAVIGVHALLGDDGDPVVTTGLCASCDQWLVNLAIDGRSARVREADAGTSCIALARVESTTQLREAMVAGASDWLTIPFTPQQLVGALQRAAVALEAPVLWDLGTCVPQIHNLETTRPVIEAIPDGNVDPLVVAWSLRRFTRGYDDLAIVDGKLLLLPFARSEHLWFIIERLTVMMGERAMLLPYEPPQLQRFEASA